MQIPEDFKRKISRAFGEKGSAWLGDLDRLLSVCIRRWNLTHCRLPEELSYNLVCFAESPRVPSISGEVVLKIGVPHPELLTEMKALSLYQGRNICACYDSDTELYALLLERIIPGPDLTIIQNNTTRIEIAADLAGKLPIPVDGHDGFPTYDEWINRAFGKARKEGRASSKILSLVNEAEKLFSEIKAADRPKVLLHGDLHHKNILQDRNGLWKAIDPKGVIGIPCMEASRFMLNQFRMTESSGRNGCLDEMATIFSCKFGETKRTMAIYGFIEYVLATCWSIEEHCEPDELSESINHCELFLTYAQNFEK